MAARFGHPEFAAELVRAGAPLDSRTELGATPLWFALESSHFGEGHLGVARLLLEEGAAVDARIKEPRWTILHMTAARKNLAGTSLLLAHGAAIDARNSAGRTPLALAAYKGHEEVVRLLLSRGAAVDSRDDKGRTALHWAAQYGQAAIMKLLLASGAADDATSDAGWMPLHVAARMKKLDAVRLLLERGALITLAQNVVDCDRRRRRLLESAPVAHRTRRKRKADSRA